MYKLSLPWVVWLMLGPLVAADASPQFPTDIVTKTLEFLKGGKSPTPSPTVCNCMGETSDSLVNWQNPDFPKNESLPGICTLTLNPPQGTCAYRLNFDNLDLSENAFSYATLLSAFSCPTYNPYIMVSSLNYTTPARCQDLTGYEGVVQLPEKSTEPVVILLKTNPGFNFTFRVNISAVPCADIKSFKSPSNCGIKNQKLSTSSRKNLRSDDLPQDATLPNIESIEESRSSRQLSGEPLAEPETDDSQALNQDDSTSNNPEYRRLQQKKKKKNQEKVKHQAKPEKMVEIGEDAKEFAKKLKEAGNIMSYGLGVSIEQGKVEHKPNMNNNRIIGTTTIPNEYPWMVFIEYMIMAIHPLVGRLEIPIGCSGTLLDDSHVITQASCLPGVRNTNLKKVLDKVLEDFGFGPFSEANYGSLESVRVILGAHDVSDPTDTQSLNVTVSKVTFPMTYNSIRVKDDKAVLTLSEPIEFKDNVKPVCFQVSYNKFKDDIGILTGWPERALINDPSPILENGVGITFPNKSSVPELNEIDVIVQDKSICNSLIGFLEEAQTFLTEKTSLDEDDYVCITDKEQNPVCDVGLGTPLVRQDQTNAHFLYGISSVFQSCNTFQPSIFTAIKPDDPFLNLALT